jgi:DNA-binding Xre family transcriptional regulator
MDARVNVPRIVQAMKANDWGKAATAVNCGMNNKTLAKILDGKVPQRFDALYRLCDGLKIPIQEVLIAPTYKATQGSRLYLVSGRRRSDEIA